MREGRWKGGERERERESEREREREREGRERGREREREVGGRKDEYTKFSAHTKICYQLFQAT